MAKKLQRWNWKKREYEDYEIPDNWLVATYAFDMDTGIDCASCGKVVPYGLMYTSMEIHTEMGMGYCVCQECHEEERYVCLKFGRTH